MVYVSKISNKEYLTLKKKKKKDKQEWWRMSQDREFKVILSYRALEATLSYPELLDT